MNRGRFQAQGDGLEKSENWATDNEFNKREANSKIKDLKEKLSRAELARRTIAFDKANRLVDNSPSMGHPAVVIKSYYDSPINRSIRVDVEIREGNAFINENE